MIEHPFEALPYGKVGKIQEGLSRLKLPLPYKLNHVNAWLIDDEGRTAVYDTGVNSKSCKDCWNDALREDADVRLIVSHYHPDHVGLAAWFIQHKGCGLEMTRVEWDMVRMLKKLSSEEVKQRHVTFLQSHGLDEEQSRELLAMRRSYPDDVYGTLPELDACHKEGDGISIGGSTWLVMEGPGHSPAQLCLYSEERRVLIAADQILPRISPNISLYGLLSNTDPDPLGSYLASLNRFGALPEDTLALPSHGEPFYGLRERAESLKAHHESHLSRIMELCRSAPMHAGNIAGNLFPANLDAHQLVFAFGEATAHLEHLRLTGKLEASKHRGVNYFSAQ